METLPRFGLEEFLWRNCIKGFDWLLRRKKGFDWLLRRKGEKEKGRKEGREEGRKGGREEGRKGGREEGRKGGRVEGRRSKVNVKVNYHHHVMHVGHLGHFLHVPRIGHLVQCYCFRSILYKWADATGGEIGRRL